MSRPVLFLLALSLAIAGCDSGQVLPGVGDADELPVEAVALPGVDRLSTGGSLEVVVRTQEEYEQLIDELYRAPLSEYCNENYPGEKRRLEREHPDLSEEEVQARLNALCIEETPFFSGLEDVSRPEIDFSEHSLLGQAAHASGCSTPDYDFRLTEADGAYTFSVEVTQYGMCEMAISKNLWILTPKIPAGSAVSFESSYEQQSREE